MTQRAPPLFDSYVLCASPRSGSTLLCELLAATGLAGVPDSFFMEGLDPHWTGVWGLPVETTPADPAAHARAYLAAVQKAGRGATDVFGLRLMQATLPRLMAMIDTACPGLPSDKDRLTWAFGKTLYVHLSRRDKLAQAVSMVKAEQTGLWHIAPDGSELERVAPPAEARYDFDRIADRLALLETADADWHDWFAAQHIAPLTLQYETLSADPAQTVRAVLSALGHAPPACAPAVATGKLADAISAAWIRRFQVEAGRAGPG